MKKLTTFALLLGASCAVTPVFAEGNEGGEEIYNSYCSACHSLEPPPKLAPPMRGIMMHYRSSSKDAAALADQIHSWVSHPKVEASKIPGAVSRFNLMPPMPIDRDKAGRLADWLWGKFNSDGNNCPGMGMNK